MNLFSSKPSGAAITLQRRRDAMAPPLPRFQERAPWLGADLQTLRNSLRGAPSDLRGGERLQLPMRDGDRLTARLDRPAADAPLPLVVIVHGLTGSEASATVVATARHLLEQGWPVLRLNLRGNRLSRATSAGRYHAGKTEDLADALRGLPLCLTRRGVVALGHSLGGNLVLKFLGEGAHGLPVLAGVAVSTPLDLAATCLRMMTPRNVLYHRYLLAEMKREALAPGAALTSAQRFAVATARNVYEFDDAFVAPLFGYSGAQHYYESNSAMQFLAAIAQPTLILHALDDPWIPPTCYSAVDWSSLPAIDALLIEEGGHLGFHGVGSPVPWHDRATAHWLARVIQKT